MNKTTFTTELLEFIEKAKSEKIHPRAEQAFEYFQPQLISNLVVLNICESLDLVRQEYISLVKYSFEVDASRFSAYNPNENDKYFKIEQKEYLHLNYLVENTGRFKNEKCASLKIDLSTVAEVREEVLNFLIEKFNEEYKDVGLAAKKGTTSNNGTIIEIDFLIDMEKVKKEALDKLVKDCGFDHYMTLEEFSQAFSKAVYAQ